MYRAIWTSICECLCIKGTLSELCMHVVCCFHDDSCLHLSHFIQLMSTITIAPGILHSQLYYDSSRNCRKQGLTVWPPCVRPSISGQCMPGPILFKLHTYIILLGIHRHVHLFYNPIQDGWMAAISVLKCIKIHYFGHSGTWSQLWLGEFHSNLVHALNRMGPWCTSLSLADRIKYDRLTAILF